jgi:hypothetical protein
LHTLFPVNLLIYLNILTSICLRGHVPSIPKAHFLRKQETVMSGKPLMAEKPMSLSARLMMNILGGVRRDFVLNKANRIRLMMNIVRY